MIHDIEIKGYRLLDEFRADFSPLTVIIGANASGKSSLLACLTMITGSMELPLQSLLNIHMLLSAGSATEFFSWRLTFRKPSNGFWSRLPIDADRDYVYEVELEANTYGQAIPRYECLKSMGPHAGNEMPLTLLEATRDRSLI